MAYTRTTWADGVTVFDAAKLNNMETELVLLDGRIVPDPAAQAGKWLKDVSGAMVWSDINAEYQSRTEKAAANGYASLDGTGKIPLAQMPAGAGGGVDYKGAWSGATAYQGGDVVASAGAQYIAVNPSTNQVPPAINAPPGTMGVISLVTALPSSPFDGQEVVLTDSLTAGTYFWRLRYSAGKTSNKWVFVGGFPKMVVVDTAETSTSGTYAALTTAGPSFTIPVVGDYLIEPSYVGGSNSTDAHGFMSFDVGVTGALDIDAASWGPGVADSTRYGTGMNARLKTGLAAGTALVSKYRVVGSSPSIAFRARTLRVTPMAVGG